MTLRWKSFERGLRRRVRLVLRASKTGSRDYRLAQKRRRQNLQVRPWFGRLMFLCVGLFMLVQTRRAGALIPFMMLWTLGSMCIRASQLFAALYASPNLNVFNLLPLADSDIFRAQSRGLLRPLAWSAADFAVLYSVLLWRSHAGVAIPLAGVALGLIHGVFVGAGALCLYAYGPRRLFLLGGTLFIGAAVALLVFASQSPAICDWLTPIAPWIPPLGWTLYALGVTPAHGVFPDLLPCGLSALLLVLAPMTYRLLRDRYSLNEQLFAIARRVTLGTDSIGRPEWVERFAIPPERGASALQTPDFHTGLDWAGIPPLDRAIAKWLTPRERLIAEFLVAGSPLWSKGVGSLVVAVLVGAVIWRLFVPQLEVQILFFLGIYYLVVNTGLWPGLVAPRGGGVQSPLYALYPLDFWDLARVLLKVNLARFLLCAPIALALVAFVLVSDSRGLAGVKFIMLGLVAQPVLVIGLISPQTNDSQKHKVVFLALLFIVSMVASCITFLLASSVQVLLVSGTVLALLAIGALASYGRLFDRSQFDLVPPVGTKTQV